MSTFLLDTSVIIDALNDKRDRHSLLLGLYAGMRPKEEAATTAFLQSLQLYPATWPVARLAGELKRDYGRKGKTLNLDDVIIAATALHNRLTLLTDNVKDFPMQDLSLYPLP